MNTEQKSLSGPPEFFEMKRAFQIEFLKSQGLKPKHHLLDLGCGNLRGGIPIIAHLNPGHYIGIDSRPDVIHEARRELWDHDLECRNPLLLWVTENTELHFARRFDVIWAFSILMHVTDEDLDRLLRFIKEHLCGSGSFYANVNAGSEPESKWENFPVVWRPLDFYSEMCRRWGLALTDLGPLKDLGHNSGDEAGDNQRMLKVMLI